MVRLLNFRPVHHRGASSRIEVAIELTYLRGQPVEFVVITPERALELIEQLAQSVNIVTRVNAEGK